jgi:hypothetical protein
LPLKATAVRGARLYGRQGFLIDKNNADRIRVLEKGVGDEGTRVVRNVSRNPYEPLRSAFGAFVAETTFIGNCNLMVEGPADQILLGGATTHLRLRGRHDSENCIRFGAGRSPRPKPPVQFYENQIFHNGRHNRQGLFRCEE